MLPSPEKFDPIYAALVGALIAILGSWISVLITGHQASKRQTNDLLHSSDEKQKERAHIATQKELERLHAIRRECYLPFMDTMSSAVGFVPTIPTCPLDVLRTLTPLIDLGRHISKITLIAPPSVIEPVTAGFIFLQSVATNLIRQRWAIERVANDIELNKSSVQMMLDRQKNLGERMDAMMDTGEIKPQFQHLYQQHEDLGERIKVLLGEHGCLVKKRLI